jgi:hypothetical protein
MIQVYRKNLYAPGNCVFCADQFQEVRAVTVIWGIRPAYPQAAKWSYSVCEMHRWPQPAASMDPAAVGALEALDECKRKINKQWANQS